MILHAASVISVPGMSDDSLQPSSRRQKVKVVSPTFEEHNITFEVPQHQPEGPSAASRTAGAPFQKLDLRSKFVQTTDKMLQATTDFANWVRDEVSALERLQSEQQTATFPRQSSHFAAAFPRQSSQFARQSSQFAREGSRFFSGDGSQQWSDFETGLKLALDGLQGAHKSAVDQLLEQVPPQGMLEDMLLWAGQNAGHQGDKDALELQVDFLKQLVADLQQQMADFGMYTDVLVGHLARKEEALQYLTTTFYTETSYLRRRLEGDKGLSCAEAEPADFTDLQKLREILSVDDLGQEVRKMRAIATADKVRMQRHHNQVADTLEFQSNALRQLVALQGKQLEHERFDMARRLQAIETVVRRAGLGLLYPKQACSNPLGSEPDPWYALEEEVQRMMNGGVLQYLKQRVVACEQELVETKAQLETLQVTCAEQKVQIGASHDQMRQAVMDAFMKAHKICMTEPGLLRAAERIQEAAAGLMTTSLQVQLLANRRQVGMDVLSGAFEELVAADGGLMDGLDEDQQQKPRMLCARFYGLLMEERERAADLVKQVAAYKVLHEAHALRTDEIRKATEAKKVQMLAKAHAAPEALPPVMELLHLWQAADQEAHGLRQVIHGLEVQLQAANQEVATLLAQRTAAEEESREFDSSINMVRYYQSMLQEAYPVIRMLMRVAHSKLASDCDRRPIDIYLRNARRRRERTTELLKSFPPGDLKVPHIMQHQQHQQAIQVELEDLKAALQAACLSTHDSSSSSLVALLKKQKKVSDHTGGTKAIPEAAVVRFFEDVQAQVPLLDPWGQLEARAYMLLDLIALAASSAEQRSLETPIIMPRLFHRLKQLMVWDEMKLSVHQRMQDILVGAVYDVHSLPQTVATQTDAGYEAKEQPGSLAGPSQHAPGEVPYLSRQISTMVGLGSRQSTSMPCANAWTTMGTNVHHAPSDHLVPEPEERPWNSKQWNDDALAYVSLLERKMEQLKARLQTNQDLAQMLDTSKLLELRQRQHGYKRSEKLDCRTNSLIQKAASASQLRSLSSPKSPLPSSPKRKHSPAPLSLPVLPKDSHGSVAMHSPVSGSEEQNGNPKLAVIATLEHKVRQLEAVCVCGQREFDSLLGSPVWAEENMTAEEKVHDLTSARRCRQNLNSLSSLLTGWKHLPLNDFSDEPIQPPRVSAVAAVSCSNLPNALKPVRTKSLCRMLGLRSPDMSEVNSPCSPTFSDPRSPTFRARQNSPVSPLSSFHEFAREDRRHQSHVISITRDCLAYAEELEVVKSELWQVLGASQSMAESLAVEKLERAYLLEEVEVLSTQRKTLRLEIRELEEAKKDLIGDIKDFSDGAKETMVTELTGLPMAQHEDWQELSSGSPQSHNTLPKSVKSSMSAFGSEALAGLLGSTEADEARSIAQESIGKLRTVHGALKRLQSTVSVACGKCTCGEVWNLRQVDLTECDDIVIPELPVEPPKSSRWGRLLALGQAARLGQRFEPQASARESVSRSPSPIATESGYDGYNVVSLPSPIVCPPKPLRALRFSTLGRTRALEVAQAALSLTTGFAEEDIQSGTQSSQARSLDLKRGLGRSLDLQQAQKGLHCLALELWDEMDDAAQSKELKNVMEPLELTVALPKKKAVKSRSSAPASPAMPVRRRGVKPKASSELVLPVTHQPTVVRRVQRHRVNPPAVGSGTDFAFSQRIEGPSMTSVAYPNDGNTIKE
uniref:Uncharacterized protein n=1 Tax=Eutreptiella gymnastica TaxID=73025 RepID=A0A7S1N179_9EUGL|mmetsp:Transcript_105625/g.182135  ORF Transcript_105625/g.182135 Transcript_105625/m.182135 type:complete len:1694 (+) Transcript_105625:161-5242(+)